MGSITHEKFLITKYFQTTVFSIIFIVIIVEQKDQIYKIWSDLK